jgi:hypothetical protein
MIYLGQKTMTDAELLEHIDKVAAEYIGDVSYLSSAIGAVMLGRLYGWRVIRITTTSKVYTRHQRILSLDFKKVLPEETVLSKKSIGYSLAKRWGNFWDVVNSKVRIEPQEKMFFNNPID